MEASEENPADIGSRCCHGYKLPPTWFQGLEWLKDKGLWPQELTAKSSIESEAEAQPIKNIFKESCKKEISSTKFKKEMSTGKQ